VTASDGTALVDLVLDRNPFMLANGPRRAARPHALMVPGSHRDGWSLATASELAACRTAMTLAGAPDVSTGPVKAHDPARAGNSTSVVLLIRSAIIGRSASL
jgi:hypothetical protein